MPSSPFPLPPGAAIGIVGGGQLGRMMALAAARLGFDVVILTPDAGSPAGRVAMREIVGAYDDPVALATLAAACPVVTFEFENIPADALAALQAHGAVAAPPAQALAVSQDRLAEKAFLNAAGLTTAPFAAIDREDDIPAALERLGVPALLKTRREGYDGKGQAWIASPDAGAAALHGLGGRPCVLEGKVAFHREISVIAARGRDDAFCAYPVGENHHEGGVLRRSLAPAPGWRTDQPRAEAIARRILEALDYVGVIGVELFQLADGALVVNEFAPRVHNTGHWTLDGCEVDQFEQHIRAVAGWPLGPTAPLAAVEMTNLLGVEAEAWQALAGDRTARLWLYGKRGSAPGRKMGHVNRLRPLP